MFRKTKAKISKLNSDTKNQEYQAEAYKLKKKIRIIGLITTGLGYLIAAIGAIWIGRCVPYMSYSGSDVMRILEPMIGPMIVTFVGGIMSAVGLPLYRLSKTVVVTQETIDALKNAKAQSDKTSDNASAEDDKQK